MPQVRCIKTRVAREERGVAYSAQQNDLLILHAFAAKVDSDLPGRQAPRVKQQTPTIQGCSHRGRSGLRSSEDVFGSGVLFGTIAKCLARQPDRLGNGGGIYAAPPLLHNGFPRDTGGYLLKDIRYQYPGSPERRLAMADCRVGYDKAPDYSFDFPPSRFLNDASMTMRPGQRIAALNVAQPDRLASSARRQAVLRPRSG